MFKAFMQSWALFFGLFLLMIGNGVQGTLLGIRGDMEGFSTIELSFVMSAYFAGFLGGSQMAPELIRRVGHVRVFSALASFISAVLILYPTVTNPWAWVLLRIIVGFCMSATYVTVESWLNGKATNENRGQTLSVYMIVQAAGIVAAQGLPMLGDPSGFILFVIPSVLVSISMAPVLLSVQPTPPFDTTKRMKIGRLFRLSPLGCVGILIMGGVYAGTFGMASVWGAQAGLSKDQIALFVAMIYVGGLVFQFPIGWLSDRTDRRKMIAAAAALGAVACILPLMSSAFPLLLLVALVVGGVSNPLYTLLVAHTNDFLDRDNMAGASGQLLFLNGVAAIFGPLVSGVIMQSAGPSGFFVYMMVLLAMVAVYAAYRMTRRPAPPADETMDFPPVTPMSTVVAIEAVQAAPEPEEEDEPIEAGAGRASAG